MNTIGFKLVSSIVLYLMIPVLLTFYLMDKPLEKVIERNLGKSAQDSLYLVGLNVNLLFQDMLQASVQISGRSEVVSVLRKPEAFSEFSKLRLNDEILNRQTSSYFSNTYSTLIDLYGHRLSTSYMSDSSMTRLTESGWYKGMMTRPYQLKWMFSSRNPWYADSKPLVTLVRTVTDPQSNRNVGMILFSVAEEDLRKYLSGLDGRLYLVDQEGTVVSSSAKDAIGTKLSDVVGNLSYAGGGKGQEILVKDGRKWIVNYHSVGANGWKVVQLVSYDTVFREIFDIRRTNIIIFALIFIVFFLITLSIAYGISRPLKLLRKRMEELEGKDFNSSISVRGPKEIAALNDTYNKMVKEIRTLLQRVKEEYQQKEDMRFRALQAQINPHFLLNTINNIKWMAYIRSDNDVGDMLSHLGGILEGSIGRGGNLIPLRQELDYIHNYIGLMQIKYPDRLKIEMDVPEELMEQEVIQIMLQPFIENCLQHGIDPMDGVGIITIRARSEGDRFVLTLGDNGVGMPEQRLRTVRELLASPDGGEPPERIGIKNVHDRLRLQYGEPYGVDLFSEPGTGTVAEFRLPTKKARGGMGNGPSSHAR
ncbi:sensor histidine kinase [Cohnella sp. AR92]|nr:sensor histidine kinase [Cohnella sp. AR92]